MYYFLSLSFSGEVGFTVKILYKNLCFVFMFDLRGGWGDFENKTEENGLLSWVYFLLLCKGFLHISLFY